MANALKTLKQAFGWTDPSGVFGMADRKMEGAKMKYDMLRNQLAQQNVMISAYGGGGGGGGIGGQWNYNTPVMPNPDLFELPALKMEDLEGPAGKASLEELKDLWRARWSDRWVKRGEINDEFYTVCAQRLLTSDRLEAHELADGTHVYRLIEK
jgi:hypothetical protein